jgi:hypothetical protein
MRIHQHQLELALQNGPYRAPVNSGCLHHHVRDLVLLQPIGQAQQIPRHRPETSLLLALLAVWLAADHAAVDALLMHVQPGAPRMYDFHDSSLSGLRRRKPLVVRISFACSPSKMAATIRCASGPPGQTPMRASRHHGKNRPCSRRIPRLRYSNSRLFSSFVVTQRVMENSYCFSYTLMVRSVLPWAFVRFNVMVSVLPSSDMEVVPRTAILPSRVRTKDSE